MGSLPQWRKEKYSGRTKALGTYILTRGNGHGHAFVIRVSDGDDFINLDDFASARVPGDHQTRAAAGVLSVFWIFLLIMVGGMEQDTWFLLLVGLIGMFQNVLVAGLKRDSAAHGLPLKFDGEIKVPHPTKAHKTVVTSYIDQDHVLPALRSADEIRPGVGKGLIPLFFPIGLKPHQEWWNREEDNSGTSLAVPGILGQASGDSVERVREMQASTTH